MCAWRGALPLSIHTLKIAFSGFGLSSGLALRLVSVLKLVHLRGSPVPLAKPSPTEHGSRRTTHQMSNDPTNREENMSTARSVDETRQRGRKAAQTDTEIPEQPDLGAQPFKMSNGPTNREEKKSRKPDPSTNTSKEAEN